MYEENRVVDGEFSTIDTSDREIQGKPSYYTTGQVATMLEEKDSTIRYWCDEFEESVPVLKVGANNSRRFTENDIEKLRMIKDLLKNHNLSVKQVKDFLKVKPAETTAISFLEEINPKQQLMMQAILAPVLQHIEGQISQMEDRIVQRVKLELASQSIEHQQVAESIQQEILNVREQLSQDIIVQAQEQAHAVQELMDSVKHSAALHETTLSEKTARLEEKLDEVIQSRMDRKKKGLLSFFK